MKVANISTGHARKKRKIPRSQKRVATLARRSENDDCDSEIEVRLEEIQFRFSACPSLSAHEIRFVWNSENKMKPLKGFAGRPRYGKKRSKDATCNSGFEWPIKGRFMSAHRGKRHRFYKTIQISVECMIQHISGDDIDYMTWWTKLASWDTCIILKIVGISALEVQESLSTMHRMHGVLDGGWSEMNGHTRHVVFSDVNHRRDICYLVINKYALRTYRCASLSYALPEQTMPFAPLLIQMWSQVPKGEYQSTEQGVRRAGMRSVLCWMGNKFNNNKAAVETRIYKTTECPQFEIYDILPEVVSLLCKTSNGIRNDVLSCTRDQDACKKTVSLYSNLASFVFQKDQHRIHISVLRRLYMLFQEGIESSRRRTKYPIAYTIIRKLHEYAQAEDTPWISCDLNVPKLDFSVDFEEKGIRPPSEGVPAHHYLFKLCVENELFTLDMRTDIVRAICLPYRIFPVDASKKTTVKAQCYSKFKNSLYSYEQTLVKQHPFISNVQGARQTTEIEVCPSGSHTGDLWPLNSLYTLLAFMEYVPTVKVDAKNPKMSEAEKDYPVFIKSPAMFASQKHLNLPVAFDKIDGELLYMEESILLHPGKLSQSANINHLEAFTMVRDLEYYMDGDDTIT